MHSEDNAVRKAVSVLACKRPEGVPLGWKSVIAPVGRMTGFLVAPVVAAALSAAVVRVMTGWDGGVSVEVWTDRGKG